MDPFRMLMIMARIRFEERTNRRMVQPGELDLTDQMAAALCDTGYFRFIDQKYLSLSDAGQLAWERLQHAADALVEDALRRVLNAGRLTLG